MDTNVQALKNLYEQLGGDPADVADISTNADMINAIAELDIGGGGGTVDQTYDATSTNAQSGTAVAQAVANVPAPSYTLTRISQFASFPQGSTNGTTATLTLNKTIKTNKLYFLCVTVSSSIGKVLFPVDFSALNDVNGFYAPYFKVDTGAFIGAVVATGLTGTTMTLTLKCTNTTSDPLSVSLFEYS